MRFIEHGPDIPDELLLALDEERVVFFCGAVQRIEKKLDLPGLVMVCSILSFAWFVRFGQERRLFFGSE